MGKNTEIISLLSDEKILREGEGDEEEMGNSKKWFTIQIQKLKVFQAHI